MASGRPWLGSLAAALILTTSGWTAPTQAATATSIDFTLTMSDGVALKATLVGTGNKPTVIEFSPYGSGSASLAVGPAYNYLLVQTRGTGSSGGTFDALGPRTQADVVDVDRWACAQKWSTGRLAMVGFSASAITIYNSLHAKLSCVKALVLRSGTFELYRDLLVPGGILNLVPGLGVLALIGLPALQQGGDRLSKDPTSIPGVITGLLSAGLAGIQHPSLDAWWAQRGFRGDVNKIPTLVLDSFFDVEPRGAFEGYQQLRAEHVPAHLLVVGGHDGAPVGTDDGVPAANAWLDHYVRGVNNGVQNQPAVQMLLAEGSRESYLAGKFVRATAPNWPVPGTTWAALNLSSARSGSAQSVNDGALTLANPGAKATQTALSLASPPTETDVPTMALLGSSGANQLSALVPQLTQMNTAEHLGLTYTTPALKRTVTAAGPLDLDIPLSTTTPGSGIWAVLSDVAPDGTSYPLSVGRLNTNYPGIVAAKSRTAGGALIQPYGDFSSVSSALPGVARIYHVELWPVGNRFAVGHRIRLDIVGVSAFSPLSLPGITSVIVGQGSGAVLQFPVLPGSDLLAALG